MPRKRILVVVLEKGEESRSSGSKKPAYVEESLCSLPFYICSFWPEEAYCSLRTMCKRWSCYLAGCALPSLSWRSKRLDVLFLSSKERSYSWTERRLEKDLLWKAQTGEILFHEDRPLSIDELPFPRNWDRGWVEHPVCFLRGTLLPLKELFPSRGASESRSWFPPRGVIKIQKLQNLFRSYQQILSSKLKWNSGSRAIYSQSQRRLTRTSVVLSLKVFFFFSNLLT